MYIVSTLLVHIGNSSLLTHDAREYFEGKSRKIDRSLWDSMSTSERYTFCISFTKTGQNQ
jgi:hypothetical protein